MQFKTFTSGDSQIFITIDNGHTTKLKNNFVFTGFMNGIHPFHRRRINRIVEILQSKGIILNVAEVPTVDDMGQSNGEFDMSGLSIPKGFDIKSSDGNTYILFQDTEMGRGWACLIKNEEILSQDHRDNLLDEIEEGEFIKSFSIDYTMEYVDDLTEITKKYK